jgi:hypothetical protein
MYRAEAAATVVSSDGRLLRHHLPRWDEHAGASDTARAWSLSARRPWWRTLADGDRFSSGFAVSLAPVLAGKEAAFAAGSDVAHSAPEAAALYRADQRKHGGGRTGRARMGRGAAVIRALAHCCPRLEPSAAARSSDTRVIISAYRPGGRAKITRVSLVIRPAGLGDLRSSCRIFACTLLRQISAMAEQISGSVLSGSSSELLDACRFGLADMPFVRRWARLRSAGHSDVEPAAH